MIRVTLALLGALVLLPALNCSADAVPITLTFGGTGGSGSIGATSFSNKSFTITAVGDTSTVIDEGFGVLHLDHTTASIVIDGVGTYNFITPTYTFFNDNIDLPGFARTAAFGTDLYDGPTIAALDGWDMTTSVGPFAGTFRLLQWANDPPVVTSGGVLAFDDAFVSGSFAASVSTAAVPLPGAFVLFGTGAALLGAAGLRRRRKAAAV